MELHFYPRTFDYICRKIVQSMENAYTKRSRQPLGRPSQIVLYLALSTLKGEMEKITYKLIETEPIIMEENRASDKELNQSIYGCAQWTSIMEAFISSTLGSLSFTFRGSQFNETAENSA